VNISRSAAKCSVGWLLTRPSFFGIFTISSRIFTPFFFSIGIYFYIVKNRKSGINLFLFLLYKVYYLKFPMRLSIISIVKRGQLS